MFMFPSKLIFLPFKTFKYAKKVKYTNEYDFFKEIFPPPANLENGLWLGSSQFALKAL